MNDCEVELKSTLGEKIFVTLLFAFVGCFTGIGFVLTAIVPEVVGAARDISQVKLSMLVAGLLLFLICLYGWYLHLSYRLCANDNSMCIYSGFRHSYIAWGDIAFYRARIRNRHHEIFLDHAGHVIFRSPLHDFSMTTYALEQKYKFWQYVQEKLIDAKYLQ